MLTMPTPPETVPLLGNNGDKTDLTKENWLNHCLKPTGQVLWLATMAGGSYLAFSGGKQAVELFTENDVKYLVASISGIVTFQIFRTSEVSLENFKRDWFPCLFFGGGYAFTSAFLTFQQAPKGWQQYFWSIFNGMANLPFSMDNTSQMGDNFDKIKQQWRNLDAKSKCALFFNFLIIFFIVACCLIGFAAPVVNLIIGWLSKSIGAYITAGIYTVLCNLVEAFFQINQMLCIKEDPEQDIRRWFGYIRNPFPKDAWDNKLSSILTIIFAFITALSYGVFTGQALITSGAPVAIVFGALSLLAPMHSSIKAADAAVSRPIADGIWYLCDKIPAAWCETFKQVFCACPPKLTCFKSGSYEAL